jgi:D-alanine-D-alanine ligase-like ATP-grasp enzyme
MKLNTLENPKKSHRHEFDEMTEKVGAIAKRAYELLRMKGFSRTEFIIVDNEPFMLEMNTVRV